ncbi:MAG: type II toxin-antitoxin system prevent-host-death family antitoxin [Candidatus Limnocylindrales bacterium]
METVGIRELKNRLSLYVRKVEAGDVVIITDRGRVVAELVPPGWQRPAVGVHPGLLDLARRNGLRLPTRPYGPDLYLRPRPTVDMGGLTVQDLIDAERGDR